MHRIGTVIIIVFALFLAGGCGFVRMTTDQIQSDLSSIDFRSPIRLDAPEALNNSVLTGRISGGDDSASATIAVLAYTSHFSESQNRNTTELAGYTVIRGTGNFTLFVAPGQYYLHVFIDRNQDEHLENDEYAGRYGNPDLISVAEDQVIGGLDISLNDSGHVSSALPVSLKLNRQYFETNESLDRGGVVTLRDNTFSRDFGSKGIWTPDEFIFRHGVNIYALEPYDPDRIPILFVHGAGGTPRDWDTMVRYVDRSRFQPWFFYYPTALRLDTLADLLHARLKTLHAKYGFNRLIITAHSMGGLVSRGYINRYSGDISQNFRPTYISLSTPYDGHDQARLGAEYSPASVPSWQDVATGSDYIERMYARQLPQGVNFYLIFGYGGNSRLYRDSNDGVITVKSQLALRAKSEATRMQGFDADHVAILNSQEVVQYYTKLLRLESQSLWEAPDRIPLVGTLQIDATPATAKIQVLNTSAAYQPGMALGPGQYLVEVSAYGYKPWGNWIDLAAGENKKLDVRLVKLVADLPPSIARYVSMLQSDDIQQKRTAARSIYRENLGHPILYDTAELELRKGYRIKINDRYHIDAMSWMCQLLGLSGQSRYRTTLEMVARESGNVKLQRYAEKNIQRLNP